MCGPTQPLSLVIMHTPNNLQTTSEERYLRGRAVEISKSFSEGVCSKNAIKDMGRRLMQEGLGDVQLNDEIVDILKGQGFQTLISSSEGQIIIAYHNLIWKTAETWTLPRQVGECDVTPFLPLLLEVTQMHLNAETVTNGESYQSEETELRADIAKCVNDPDCWTEVSILEFFNSVLSKSCQLQGPKSQPIVQVISSKDSKLNWRDACDNDEVNGEEIFESAGKMYVRKHTDVRILFEQRPDKMSEMRLGQFAAEYRLCKLKDKETEVHRSKIDDHTGLGPLSTTLVAGSEQTFAPQVMMLKNGRIMVRRNSENKAVLHLLYHTTSSKYLNFLLWSSWTHLEDIDPDQEQEETEAQMMSRLSIFPLSVCEDVAEED